MAFRTYNPRKSRVSNISIPIASNLVPTQSDRVLDLWRCDDTEVCVDGPVGCTKTVQTVLKIFGLHERYPKFQSLIVRSEAKTLHTTILPQIFNKVLRYPISSKKNPFKLYGGENRASHIDFNNGGRMTFGGMDDSGKILGSEYDLIFYNQVERELKQKNWEDLIGRGLEGRAGNWPHWKYGYDRPRFQIIGDANPSAPTHWLKSREDLDQIRFISFKHEDNPLYYYNGVWTERGLRTVAELEKRYTGYMKERMVYGRWKSAEGVVYPMFKPEVEVEVFGSKRKFPFHVKYVDRGDIPAGWKWFCSIDYGSVNAMCCQLWACHPNYERHIMFREIYHTGLTPKTFIPMIQKMLSEAQVPYVEVMFTDHDASHNQDLRDAGFSIREADKDILSGLELVKDWLSKEYIIKDLPYTEPAIIFNSNSLAHPMDSNLFGKAHKTIDEFGLYAYREEDDRKGDDTDEKPKPMWDHGMDTVRYYLKGVMAYVPYQRVSEIAHFPGIK